MPFISNSNYDAPLLFSNGHLQTILPALFRNITEVNYKRERIYTPDDDFIDLDWSVKNFDQNKLVILTHGLEGNSSSKYLLGMVKALNKAGFNTLSWNMRSCSGESNKQIRFYHSGVVDDLDFVIKHASIHFKEIYLMGFSLGGNLTLNYLGRLGHKLQNSNIKKAVAFSVPCHLESCALNMARLKNRIYLKRFLKSLKAKIKDKAAIMPDKLNTDKLEKIKDFIDFDDLYTGPLHGFKDARDYYKQCSSLFVVEHIAIPTLLVNAKNDPFLSDESFPYKEAISSSYFYFEAPTSGGHCGFITFGTKLNWAESRAIEFLLAEN